MLGGLAPILIFTFREVPKVVATPGVSAKAKSFFDFIDTKIGIPIPIYLDERATGLYVESETKHLTIETQIDHKFDEAVKNDSTYQRAIQNDVTINLLGKQDSIGLGVFLALSDIVFGKVVAENYNVSYFNGPTVILQGLLGSFSSNTGTNDDLIRISVGLSKGKRQVPSVELPKFRPEVAVGGTPL